MKFTPADYEYHRQMFARMQYNMDFGNGEAYAADFTEDAVFDACPPKGARHSGKHTGRKQIAALVDMIYRNNVGHARHWLGNHVYTEEGDGFARVTSYVLILRAGEVPKAGVVLTGMYEDLLVKDSERWLVKHRRVVADPQPEHSEAPKDRLIARWDALVGQQDESKASQSPSLSQLDLSA